MTDRSALPDCHVKSSHQLNHSIPINIESRSVTQMKTFADLQYILIHIYINSYKKIDKPVTLAKDRE